MKKNKALPYVTEEFLPLFFHSISSTEILWFICIINYIYNLAKIIADDYP